MHAQNQNVWKLHDKEKEPRCRVSMVCSALFSLPRAIQRFIEVGLALLELGRHYWSWVGTTGAR